jgi:hypothetical protein
VHPDQSPDGGAEARPAASWVMGRSARWHTTEGRALLAQDPLLDDVRELRSWGLALTVLPSLPIALGTTWRAVRALHAAWLLRREPRG